MKVKLNWLNEFVDLSDLSTEEIVNTLSLHSTEVEGVSKVLYGTNLVVGHVLTCINHPDSDHLHIATVDVGSEVLQIVCGAPNIKQDMYVIVALIGCELPGGFKIKKSKIRGIESFGMICSLQELGMENKYVPAEYSEGIYYFKEKVTVGANPLELLDFCDDVLELGLTPNRGDLLSMLGCAYEASCIFNRPLKPLSYKLVEEGLNNKDLVSVSIKTDKCLSYYAKVINDVKVKESPQWLKSKLIAFGIRLNNNLVDITNYVLALFGQPLHAFDYDKVGNKILVRNANKDEKIVTLDGVERNLLDSDIVITDGKNPTCIAGVMGGLESGVTETTKNILLEAAVFDPVSIRKTYTRLDLRSESSIRYEKGVDINRTKFALDYACYLFKTLADAKISIGTVHEGISEIKDKEITVTSSYVSKYLGIDVNSDTILDIMKRLGFECKKDNDNITVYVPNRRCDISIKADIVEEVGRVLGYNDLPTTLSKTPLAGKLTSYQKKRRMIKHLLVNLGLTECVNYSLRENNNEFTYLFNENDQDISLMHPISLDRKVMRRTLVPSMLDDVKYSFNRKMNDIAIFEVGKVYSVNNNEYLEHENLSICMANTYTQTLWKGNKETVDFFVLKGIVDEVFNSLNLNVTYEKLDTIKEMHPLRTASIKLNDKVVGYIGELHPKYQQEQELKGVYVCELNLDYILKQDLQKTIYTPISKVPSVERDLALVVNKDISASRIVDVIKNTDKKLISDVIIFDLYVGDKVGKDLKSIACKVILSSNETLTDEVVNNKINKVLKNLEKELNAKLRA